MKSLQQFVSSYVLSLLVVLGVFSRLWSVFFQQDEWSGFGRVIAAQTFGLNTLFRLSGWHFTPLATLFVSTLYTLFGLHHEYYALMSLSLHALNGVLVWKLLSIVSSDRRVAVLGAILFLTAHTPSQAVHWYAASISSLPSAFFGIVSMIVFFLYLKKQRLVYLLISMVAILVGLLFRENLIFLFALYFIVGLSSRGQKSGRIVLSLVMAGFLGAYLLFRFTPGVGVFVPDSVPLTLVDRVFGRTVYLTRLIFVGLPQIFISPDRLAAFGRSLFAFVPAGDFNLFYYIEGTFQNIVYVLLWLAGFLLVRWVFVRYANPVQKRSMWIFGLFTLLSVLPFVALPGNIFLESRHFYFTMVGVAGLMASLVVILIDASKSKAARLVTLLLVGVYVLWNVQMIGHDLRSLTTVSNTRRYILSRITQLYPQLPAKTVFMATGDELPFQSGLGQMLMVVFHGNHDYSELLAERFLFDITSTGYKQTSRGVGFGYVRDPVTLQKEYCLNKLSVENVFAFTWDSQSHIIQDESESVRQTLRCP